MSEEELIERLKELKEEGAILGEDEVKILLNLIENSISKDKIIEKKTKHEQKRDFYKLNMQGYSYDRECEIIEEYEELLEN